ncbi:hypothetical protein NKH18_48455 [Streptomyces sp. M10(2022)]
MSDRGMPAAGPHPAARHLPARSMDAGALAMSTYGIPCWCSPPPTPPH